MGMGYPLIPREYITTLEGTSMTYDEYIKNPYGSGSSVVANKEMYKMMYTSKWDALLVKENGSVDFTLYRSGEKEYYAHFKIPSEVVEKFYYDTIVRFYLDPEKHSGGTIPGPLSDYDVQFYSNDPSFVYTFAHAFNKHGMMIKDLLGKMSKQALTENPDTKNPKDELGYVKSLYFAYLELKRLNLFNKNRWVTANPYTKAVWTNTVEDADEKVADRQKKGSASKKSQKQQETADAIKKAITNNKHPFASPNQSKFGHFKKTDMNTITKQKPAMNKNVGRKNSVRRSSRGR